MPPFRIYYQPCVTKDGPAWRDRPPGQVVDTIVLHHTASSGSPDNVVSYWKNLRSPNRVSAHYVIGKTGRIVRAVASKYEAWHAGTTEWNRRSIGIEICNKGDNRDPFTDMQIQAIAYVCRLEMSKHPAIKLGQLVDDGRFEHMGSITEHEVVLPGRKIDLRENFPWKKLRKYILDPPWMEPPVVLPVPDEKPPWWTKMLRWLRLYKKRHP